jgi:hypothetical protein
VQESCPKTGKVHSQNFTNGQRKGVGDPACITTRKYLTCHHLYVLDGGGPSNLIRHALANATSNLPAAVVRSLALPSRSGASETWPQTLANSWLAALARVGASRIAGLMPQSMVGAGRLRWLDNVRACRGFAAKNRARHKNTEISVNWFLAFVRSTCLSCALAITTPLERRTKCVRSVL